MATILTKKKDTTGAPATGDLTNSSGGAELAVNTADKRLYTKNSSNAVVEIGTNPGTAVTFVAGTASDPAITTTGDTNTGIFFPAADTIAFAEGGVERMRITSDGDVLIGATTSLNSVASSKPLVIESTLRPEVNLFRNNTNVVATSKFGQLNFWGNDTTSNTPIVHAFIEAVASLTHSAGDNPTDLVFGTTPDGSATAAEVVRFTQAGNVGIGTSSPGARLHVVGPALSTTTGLRLQDVTTDATNKLALIKAAHYTNSQAPVTMLFGSMSSAANSIRIGGSYSQENAATEITFYTAANNTTLNGTERARITSDGALLVGTTSADTSQFRVVGSPTGDSAQISNESGSFSNSILNLRGNRNTTNGSWRFLTCRNVASASDRLYILDSGNVQNVNNSYGSISDVKLKQDIVDAGSQWDDIKNLRIRKYHLKSDPDGFMHIGLVAQEAEEVSPGLIEEHKDIGQEIRTREVEKTREVEVTPAVLDEDGNVVEPAVMETETYTEEEEYTETIDLGTTTKSVKYSILYMKAVKALQEAMERIETLEAKVSALEAQ
jgi:hypothetical protein